MRSPVYSTIRLPAGIASSANTPKPCTDERLSDKRKLASRGLMVAVTAPPGLGFYRQRPITEYEPPFGSPVFFEFRSRRVTLRSPSFGLAVTFDADLACVFFMDPRQLSRTVTYRHRITVEYEP